MLEREHLDVGPLEPTRELRGHVGQRDDRVPPAIDGQPVDQVDDSVLEPAHAEAVDDVDNQRCTGARHGQRAAPGLPVVDASTRRKAS